jgi:hypothetical protein
MAAPQNGQSTASSSRTDWPQEGQVGRDMRVTPRVMQRVDWERIEDSGAERECRRGSLLKSAGQGERSREDHEENVVKHHSQRRP